MTRLQNNKISYQVGNDFGEGGFQEFIVFTKHHGVQVHGIIFFVSTTNSSFHALKNTLHAFKFWEFLQMLYHFSRYGRMSQWFEQSQNHVAKAVGLVVTHPQGLVNCIPFDIGCNEARKSNPTFDTNASAF